MHSGQSPDSRTDIVILVVLGLARLVIHLLTNGQYGFHRDELAVLDEASHLAWGYVAYPPLTPFIGRVAMEIFGLSLVGIRFFAALGQCIAMVITGLMARELGGGRRAQVLAALAMGIAPMSLIQGALFQYVGFDYLWWVLSAYFVIRLLKSGDARWWLAIGTIIGLGMMTKTTMAFWIAGIVGGTLLTPARRFLRSPWLWAGAGLALLIFLPNLLWQWQHDFVSLEFLSAIHARDVEIGRADGFLALQPLINVNLFTLPLWLAGLYFYCFSPAGKHYRMLGWMFFIPFLLLWVTQARFYYLAPVYPMLLAAGAVLSEQWLAERTLRKSRIGWGITWSALALGGVVFGALMLPVAPINSSLWDVSAGLHDNFVEQVGWPDLVAAVTEIYNALPEEEKPVTGILAGNYGEAGAINLFGPQHNLPPAISGVNTYWLRGYGDPPPQVLIVLGYNLEDGEGTFADCDIAGRVTNAYGVENEETRFHPDILVCRGLLMPWPEFWEMVQSFQ